MSDNLALRSESVLSSKSIVGKSSQRTVGEIVSGVGSLRCAPSISTNLRGFTGELVDGLAKFSKNPILRVA